MLIRHGTAADRAALAKIEEISYPQEEAASAGTIGERLAAFPEHFWILEEADGIVAFINGMVTDLPDLTDEMYEHAGMHDEGGEWQMIFSVVTAPEHRGRGHAGALLKRVIADAQSENRRGIVLTCKERLLDFYGRFGFVGEGVSGSTHGGVVWYQMRMTF